MLRRPGTFVTIDVPALNDIEVVRKKAKELKIAMIKSLIDSL